MQKAADHLAGLFGKLSKVFSQSEEEAICVFDSDWLTEERMDALAPVVETECEPDDFDAFVQGPRSRGGKGGSCPPNFLADNIIYLIYYCNYRRYAYPGTYKYARMQATLHSGVLTAAAPSILYVDSFFLFCYCAMLDA